MPAADQADPPAAPATDVPRHVADLSDVQRCADSKKDDVVDRTSVNTQSWIAFRFQFYMALITRVRAPAIGHLGERQASIHHQPCRLGALQELRLRHIAAF